MVTDFYKLQKQAAREGYELYAGSDAAKLSMETKQAIAEQVAFEIKKHSHTMISYTDQDILISMNEGRAGCILDYDGRLLSFVQIWEYERESEQFFTGEAAFDSKVVYEVGTWLSFERGFGSKLLMTFVGLWTEKLPDAEIISIIEKDNKRAANIFTALGGKRIGYKRTAKLTDESGKNPLMNIYAFKRNKENL